MQTRPLFTALTFALALTSAGCSDSDTPQRQRSIAAPIAGVAPPPAADGPALKPQPIPAAPKVAARGYFLMDFTSGQVLTAMNENERLEPASLTKLMTAYAVFHSLKSGRISLADEVHISPYAREQDGSRMFVEVNSRVSVESLIQGMIVQSGNDATVALAEHVAGSEPLFVDLMNQYARQLGLTSTHFQNSPGMPGPEHYTTARDVAVLSAALIREYPDYYKWYSQREFTWNKITQPNRNGLLERDPSVDGLKTGHTESAGYCLVSSAKRGGMRLISVVLGSPSVRAREDASATLLNYGFAFYESRKLFDANTPILTLQVWKGAADEVKLGLAHDVHVVIPRGQASSLRAAAQVSDPIFAPLARNFEVGKLRVMLGERAIGNYPLHPIQEVAAGGFFGGIVDDVKLWFH